MADSQINADLRRLLYSSEEVIALGWTALQKARKSAPRTVHLSDKELYFAGAAFLFEAIMRVMTEEREPTTEDLVVCSKIQTEIVKFNSHFNLKFLPSTPHKGD